jgi:uncharacterized membrane protein
MNPSPPILPTHIEDTVRAIAELHRQHHRGSTPFQRFVDRLTEIVGRTRFLAFMTTALVGWIVINMFGPKAGLPAFDPQPFVWLQNVCSVVALYITVLILITQRREEELSDAREQLTLELAILGEQKNAKIIALLEEMRVDSPHLRNRYDG